MSAISMLSEDDLNVRDLTDEQLEHAWDLWFDLAQATNQWDPAYSHGVLVGLGDVPGHPAQRFATRLEEVDRDRTGR